jgi:NAD-dependent SIR2 family protein deacetylase
MTERTTAAAAAPEWAYGVRRLAILSGAGISTDSGIPDFRGPSGAWTLHPGSEKKHTYQAFLADPELRGSYWRSRSEHPAWRAGPNPGHLAVAALANSGIETIVLTQNTDGLHQLAGTPADRVIELHGTMHEVVCVGCGHRSPTAPVIARVGAGEAVPECLRCGGILKTASTMFGQTMSPEVFVRAERAVTSCDLLLAVGTTLVIEPAGSLCASAVHAGATLVIVNRDRTPYDGIATELIRNPISEALPRIAGQLLATATRAPDAPVLADSPAGTAVTAILCGAADEDPQAEDMIAAVVTPRFLMRMLMETTEEQDGRALTILSRAAATRPGLRACLTELLSVLPGLAPVAVRVALTCGQPGPLAEGLTALARGAALPADLLEAIPAGTTVLGEFPVLLAESLVEAYQQRASTQPGGLVRMRIELAERLADIGQAERAFAVARQAVAEAAQLTEPLDYPARAAQSLQRAAELARRERARRV